MPPTARKSGIVIPNRLPWYERLVITLASYIVRLLMFSWRYRWEHSEKDAPVESPVIFCIWHNRLGLAIAIWHKFAKAKWPANGVAALISASRDGAFLATAVERFDIEVIRGSSSRRGAQALLEATTWVENNHNIAITPDGPRGPCYKIQPGIIQLAQVTGCPIVPVSSFIHRKIRVRSWDRFQIPLPFTRCDVRFGSPISIPREADDDQREELRQQLEKAMLEITTD